MTPAELYDELQAMFGIGDWISDDEYGSQPWYRARMTEIGKLKRLLSSRRVDPDDVHLAALYAQRNAIPIVATWRLFELIPAARQALRADAAGPTTDLDVVIAEAAAADETDWTIRLMNVDRRDVTAVAQALKEYHDR